MTERFLRGQSRRHTPWPWCAPTRACAAAWEHHAHYRSHAPAPCAQMHVNNARWAGVPFILEAGKALDEKLVDIRVQFKPVSGA
jgi:glucose-6-phosphate 1-dehydrogenase